MDPFERGSMYFKEEVEDLFVEETESLDENGDPVTNSYWDMKSSSPKDILSSILLNLRNFYWSQFSGVTLKMGSHIPVNPIAWSLNRVVECKQQIYLSRSFGVSDPRAAEIGRALAASERLHLVRPDDTVLSIDHGLLLYWMGEHRAALQMFDCICDNQYRSIPNGR